MSRVKIEWLGDKELAIALERSSREARSQIWKVLKNNAEKGKSIAQQKAPVDTGFLKGEITTDLSDWPGLTVKIQSGAAYSGFQEYGTRYQPGTPFIRPMLEELEPTLKGDVEDVMKGAFK